MEDTGLTRALEQALEQHFGNAARVYDLALLAGGASRCIYGFSAEIAGKVEPVPLVARFSAAPGRIDGSGVDEYALVSAVYDTGAVVPRVYARGRLDNGDDQEFYVMDRVAGEAIARRLLREDRFAGARAALPEQLARSLARIHATDIHDPRLGSLRDEGAQSGSDDFATREIQRYRASLEVAAEGHPYPVLSLVGRWLEQHRPRIGKETLVHGDFRIGNVMFDEAGLTGVLDWELAHLGDPLEDIGWLSVRAWRFGNDSKPVGGLCSREAFWTLYERESGARVDRKSAFYWELFGNWKWAVICVMQAASHRAGGAPDVELAAIGRRVAETEWEMLRLLEDGHHAG